MLAVGNEHAEIKFHCTKDFTYGVVTSSIRVNNVITTSGQNSAAIALTEGATHMVTILVTAQQTSVTKAYSISVKRAPSANAYLQSLVPSIGTLTPTFSKNNLQYTLAAANSALALHLTPTKDFTYQIVSSKIIVQSPQASTVVPSGTACPTTALVEGGLTLFKVLVTAQDLVTNKVYEVKANNPN